MHLENLSPLLDHWPVLLLLLVPLSLFGWLFMQGRLRERRERQYFERSNERYWAAEMAYRAKMKVLEWLFRSRVPRLPYTPPAEEPENKRRKMEPAE